MKEVKNIDYGLEKIFEGAQDFLPLLGTDYVEFYVGLERADLHSALPAPRRVILRSGRGFLGSETNFVVDKVCFFFGSES